MIKGISQAGLGSISTEELVRSARKYGFGAVDINTDTLIADHGLEGTRQLLEDHHVIVGSIGLAVEWRQTDAIFREQLTSLAVTAYHASLLGCKSCCTYILPATDELPATYMAQSIVRLRQIASILDAYGIRLGLEFVGPHHLRTAWKHPFIHTVADTLTMIDGIDRSNVGLLVDAYHCYTTEFTADDIRQLRADQIVHVHINDAKDVPLDQVLDNDRLYPAEGVIDLPAFLQALQDIGYTGVVTQEILTQESPSDSTILLWERSQRGFDHVFRNISTL